METIKLLKKGEIFYTDPFISYDEWCDILHAADAQGRKKNIEMMLMFLRHKNNTATCAQISKKYGVHFTAAISGVVAMGKFAQKHLGNRFRVEECGDNTGETFWPIVMIGKNDATNHFEWTLRPELRDALRDFLNQKLYSAYREIILKEGLDNSSSKELYKWKTLSSCSGESTENIIRKLLKSNLIESAHEGATIQELLQTNPQELCSVFDLLREPGDLDEAISRFKPAAKGLSIEGRTSFGTERTAAAFLSAIDAEKFTPYTNTLYETYCKYLGIESKQVGKKYSHFLTLLEKLEEIERKDPDVISKIKNETSGLIYSELLNAQDILWQTQNMMNTPISGKNKFTWIPFYKEFAIKLLTFRNNRASLLEIIYGLDSKYTNYLHEEDNSPLTDIDPFTTIGIFNRSSDKSRNVILEYFKEALEISADIPQDYLSIPVLNAQKSILFSWKRNENDIENLWTVFEQALHGQDYTDSFNACLQQRGIRWNITMGLYWSDPYSFLPLDQTTREYLKEQYNITIPSFNKFSQEAYTSIMASIRSGIEAGSISEDSFPAISEAAWMTKSDNQNYWLGGYTFNGDGNQFDRFLQEGIWEGSNGQKRSFRFEEIKEGDILILKSSYTRGPRTASISCLKVKAIAIVESRGEKIHDDGYRFQVDYIPVEEKEFTNHVGGYQSTLHLCKNDEIIEWVKQILANNETIEESIIMKPSKYSEYIDLLKSNSNLILTGAPGTGKTYMANEIANEMNAEKAFVQFHPSYDYTDFVEGLRPTENGFERRDGVFKAFCKEALTNLKDSLKTVEVLSEEKNLDERMYTFLQDALDNETEFDLKTGSKFRIKKLTDTTVKVENLDNEKTTQIDVKLSEIKVVLENNLPLNNVKEIRACLNHKWGSQQDSYTYRICQKIQKLQKQTVTHVQKVQRKDFVFIIDEINRGEISKIFGELFFSVDPGYRATAENILNKKVIKVNTQYQNLVESDDPFADGFFIPENVYIIGTMNDIDRSVESMDFAIRRRFTWKEVLPEDRIDMWDDCKGSWKEEALQRMSRMNALISDGTVGLSSEYCIGPAYFRNLEKNGGDFTKLWKLHLEPLIKEYLRGNRNIKENLEKIKNAFDLVDESEESHNDF